MTVWELTEHEYSQTNTLFREIQFINTTHGWVVGQENDGLGSGVVLFTNDSGNTWQIQLEDGPTGIFQLEVIDPNSLWMTSRGRLLHSSDGGWDWDNSTIIGSGEGSQSSVRFVNLTHGWTSTNDDLFRTVDSGITWDEVSTWSYSDSAKDFHFASNEDVWIIGFYGIYFSGDNGDTWVQRYNQGGWTISFVSDREAWAVGDDMLAHMTDGQTWISQPQPRPNPFGGFNPPYYSDVEFIDASNGWITGLETPIIYTPNGGWDWYEQNVPVDTRIMSVQMLNQTHGWAAGGDGTIIRTTVGNSIGERLWKRLTDQVILLIIGVPSSMFTIALVTAIYIRRRKRRIVSLEQGTSLE